MGLKPRNDWIVIKPDGVEEKTEGGLFIPMTADKDTGLRSGIVVSVGPGWWTEYGHYKHVDKDLKGRRVAYSKYTGSEIQHGGTKYHILREFDIIAEVVND